MISWYWSAGRHDQYIRKLSLGEIVQASLDLVQVSGAVENILSNGNAQSQHSTRVNTNDEIQAKKRKGICKDLVTKTILKVIIVIAFTAKSLGASAIPSGLSPVHTSRTCRYCSYCDSAYSWEIRVKGEGAV